MQESGTGCGPGWDEECGRLIERILASEAFRRSPRQQELLRYLAERARSGTTDRLTEQSIGQDVFGRSAGYNPADDNIVRVAARQLRSRLQEYFNSEGRGESWVLEVPKGHYVPEIRANPQKGPVPPEAAGEAGEKKKLPVGKKQMTTALAAVALVTASYLIGRLSSPAEQGSRTEAPELLRAIFPGKQRINVILPDTILVLFHSITGRLMPLNEYSRHQPESTALGLSSAEAGVWSDLEGMPLTSVADTTFAATLIRSANSLRDRIRILHARQVSTPAFRTDDSIILGGPRVNPWVELFEKDLNFKFQYVHRGQHGCIVNGHPKPGERGQYGDCSNLEEDVFARLAWVPNLDRSGHVLLVGGTGMEASQAGCDFLLTSSQAGVLAIIGARSFSEVETFELLLRTTRKAGTPTVPSIVAARATFRRR